MQEERKVAVRKAILFLKKVTGFFLTVMPLAHFLYGIDTIQDLKQYPLLNPVVGFFEAYRWSILSILSVVFFATYIISYSSAYHDPVSTGGHLKNYARTKIETLYSMRSQLTEKGGISDKNLVSQIQIFAADICDRIVELMNYNFDKDFSVCVKLVEVTSSKSTTSPDQIQLRTFCRSGQDAVDRSEHDSALIPLNGNSDFLWIFEGDDCFCCSHLWWYKVWHNNILGHFGFSKARAYNSTTEKYWKRYRSTVVVPIKLRNELVTNQFVKNDKRQDQLIGFLCIDCKKRLPRSLLKKVVPYMVAFADGFYAFFDEFISARIEILEQDMDSAENHCPESDSQRIINNEVGK